MAKSRPARTRRIPGRSVLRNDVRTSQHVTIKIPERLARSTPKWLLEAPPVPMALARRHRRVPLQKPRGKLVSKTFRLIRSPHAASRTRQVGGYPAVAMVNRKNQLVQFSRKHSKKWVMNEIHQPRYKEKKGRRRKRSDLHLHSVKYDRGGIIGANMSGSVLQLADAAMVSRSLGLS